MTTGNGHAMDSRSCPFPRCRKGGSEMSLVRIRHAEPLPNYRLRLNLTDGLVIEKDVRPLFVGPVFDPVRNDPNVFAQAKVVRGTVAWPGDVDLDPDVLIWGGPPPKPSSNGGNNPAGASPLSKDPASGMDERTVELAT